MKRFKTRRRASFRRFATAKKKLKIFSEIFFFVPRLPFSVENKRVAIFGRSIEKEKKERFGGLAPRLPNCGRTPEERDALGGVRIPCPFLRQVVFDSSRSKGFFCFLTGAFGMTRFAILSFLTRLTSLRGRFRLTFRFLRKRRRKREKHLRRGAFSFILLKSGGPRTVARRSNFERKRNFVKAVK